MYKNIMILKYLVFIISILLNISIARANCSNEFSYIVMVDETGEIIDQLRSEELRHPASLTKLMTLYLTFEAINEGKISLETPIEISERSAKQWKFNADLEEGEIITVREAILGVIVKSFNDFAVSLAEVVAENEWKFVQKMNEKAKELGMENTNFKNAAGFSDKNQFSTAYDMALLVHAIKRDFPEFYPLFATKEFTFKGEKLVTHNHILVNYPYAEGMKTGFTRASGYNLATTAKKQNVSLTSILISCESIDSRDNYMVELLDRNFDRLVKPDVFIAGNNTKRK